MSYVFDEMTMAGLNAKVERFYGELSRTMAHNIFDRKKESE